MKANIIIRTQFEAVHHWPDCPIPEVSFLQHEHRHVFKVTCKAPVSHCQRDKEFIYCKHQIEDFINANYTRQDLRSTSCEMLCEEILAGFPYLNYVCVEEDGENGAEVYKEEQ